MYYLFQIVISVLLILMVLFSVGKNSDAIMGLMGTTESKNKPIKIDKATKVVFSILMIFLFSSFIYSLVISAQYASLIK